MKAAIFGAGNIGRGLLGEAFADCGYGLTFIDADAGVVEMLREDPSYGIQCSDGLRTISIDRVVDAADEEAVHSAVADANVVATAVGPAVLKIVAPAIGQGLQQSTLTEVNVLACENIHPNSAALRSHVVDACGEAGLDGVGFPNVVVDRIVPGPPGTRVVEVETRFEFVVDRNEWLGPIPKGPIVFTADLDAYKLRKLWVVNGLHAVAAWLGLQHGHEHIHGVMADAALRETVAGIGATMAHVLATRSGEFDAEELEAYCARSLDRFSDPSLPDQTKRVARNPLAKLAAGERVMAPANGADELGLDTRQFAEVIAATLSLTVPDVEGIDRLHRALEQQGWRGLIVDHCGVTADGALYRQIEERMTELSTRRGISMITEEIVITNPAGLHARPAAEIVEAAKSSPAEIRIHKGDKAANAKSIMSVLALGANTGDTVQLTVEGEGADDIAAALRRIMQSEEH